MKKTIGFALVAVALLCWLNVVVRIPELLLAARSEFPSKVAFITGQLFWNGVVLLAGIGLFRLGQRYIRPPHTPR